MKKTFILLFFGLLIEAYWCSIKSQLECLKNSHTKKNLNWNLDLKNKAEDLVKEKDISKCGKDSRVKVMKLRDAIVIQQQIKRKKRSDSKSIQQKHTGYISSSCSFYMQIKKDRLTKSVLPIYKNVGCFMKFNKSCVMVLCIYN